VALFFVFEISMTVTEQLGTLERILTQGTITTLFQPIVSLSSQRILGYEALSRGPSDSPLHSPINLLATARHAGRLHDLEMTCRQSACRRFTAHDLHGKLFLNASPETLLDPNHKPGRTLELLGQYGIEPERVVIELTEQSPTEDFELLDAALRHYRTMGFSIALDDLGAGYSSLRMWSELRPDYVKIDRYFIDGIHQDRVKREFVDSILKIAEASRSKVIAEGIELEDELRVLADMGIDLVQGYLLGRPQEQPLREPAHLPSAHPDALEDDGATLAALLIRQPAIGAERPIAELLDIFRQQASLNSIAVLDGTGRPVGIVHRSLISEALLKPFATDLLARKPVSRLMSNDLLIVDVNRSLHQVSRLLTSRARQRVDEDFVITVDGGYLGLGRVIDVLKLITEMKIQQARHANPLTLLPGNVPIRQALSRLLQQRQDAVICYVDIDNFKPFNDLYGYAKGDELLLCLAECLSDGLDPRRDFLGHIGGDDFMLVLGFTDWETRVRQLFSRFEARCRRFYRSEHLAEGCFVAENRNGQAECFALLSLSVGAVRLRGEHAEQTEASALAGLASEAKRLAKQQAGFSLHVIDVPSEAQAPIFCAASL